MILMRRGQLLALVAVVVVLGAALGFHLTAPAAFPHGSAFALLFVLVLVLCLMVYMFFSAYTEALKPKSAGPTELGEYRVYDTDTFSRAIRDGPGGREVLVHGTGLDTFREACLSDWSFTSLSPDDSWIVEDEQGNDITTYPLSSFDGIATLTTDDPQSRYGDGVGEDEESTFGSAVEYYD